MANVFDEMGVYWAEIADKNQTEKQMQFLKNHLSQMDTFWILPAEQEGTRFLLASKDTAWWVWMFPVNFSKLPSSVPTTLQWFWVICGFCPLKLKRLRL